MQVASGLAMPPRRVVASYPSRRLLAMACAMALSASLLPQPAWATLGGSNGGAGGSGSGAYGGSGGAGNGTGGQGGSGDAGLAGSGGNGGDGGHGASAISAGGAGGSVGAISIGSSSISGGDGVDGEVDPGTTFTSGGGGGGGDGVYSADTSLDLGVGLDITGGNGGGGGNGDRIGGGGGGGGAGLVSLTAGTSISNAGGISGGNGGNGATGQWSGGGGGGGDGVLVLGGASLLTNTGIIAGGRGGDAGDVTDFAGAAGEGGAGVDLASDGNSVINSGSIIGGDAPTVAGAGIVGGNGSHVANQAGGVIAGGDTLQNTTTGGNGVEVTTSGTQTATIDNAGHIHGGTGANLSLGFSGNGTGGDGISATGNVTIGNSGLVEGGQGGSNNGGGQGGIGIAITATGGEQATVTNHTGGVIRGGQGGIPAAGNIEGTGISASGDVAIVNEAGASILGDVGGIGRTSTVGGVAIVATGGVRIDNSGTVAGTGGLTAGVAIEADTTTIVNRAGGTIQGGNGQASSAGAAAIVASGQTFIDNSGSLVGGQTSIGGAQGNAVILLGGGNTLLLRAGASITGNAISLSGSGAGGDRFILGGDADAAGGNAFDIGTAVGFASYTKNGASTWTLTGTGSAAQDWTVAAGTLVGDSTSLVADVVDEASLVFDQAGDGNYAGTISGGGVLIKRGAGKLTLTGANTYTGATTIEAGTLALGGTGSMSATAVTDNGVFDISGAGSDVSIASLGGAGRVSLGARNLTLTHAADTFTGSIDGAGALVLQGGTAVLAGASTYAGGTTIHGGGTLQLGNGGATGSIVGDVVDDGSLVFDRSDTVTFAGAISGSGRVVQAGSGTLVLTGANTYSGGTLVSDGTLAGDTGNLRGAIENNATLVFMQAGDGTFDGTLSGHGTLLKSGAGTLTVDGANAFAGSTRVLAGTLVVGDDSHAGATLGGTVTVAAGATLGGIGTLGDLDLAGTLSPGNSVGTLHVSGDATFRQGASLRIDATPDGHADQLAASGKVTLLGGSALVLAQSGDWAPRTDYTIVTAAGGVSGRFASASASLAFLTPVLSYSAHAVSLSLQRNEVGFADVGVTPNQRAVAHGAESLGEGTPVYDALVKLDAPQARRAFDQLSGEIYPGTLAALVEDGRYVRDAVNRHLLGQGEGTEGSTASGTGAWLSSWGHWGRDSGDGNAAALRANGSGLLLGVDRTVGADGRLGLLLGKGQNSLDVDQRASSAHVRSHHLGVYGDTAFDALHLRAAAIHAWQDVDTRRTVAFSGFDEQLTSRRHVRLDQAYLEAGYGFASPQGHQLEAFANVARTQLHADAVRESGGQAALAVAAADPSVNNATVGVRDTFTSTSGGQLHASLAWQQSWGDVTPVASMRFVTGGGDFAIAGVPLARHALLANLGMEFPLARNLTIDASYLGQFATRYRDQGARLSLAVAF
jgi:outer membrane autotransporter protein